MELQYYIKLDVFYMKDRADNKPRLAQLYPFRHVF